MPLYTTEAIVLRTYQLGEFDRIVVLLTRDRGKKRGVARGARRSRRRFGGALEPLTWVRVAYVEREQRELVTLTYAEPLQSPLASADPEAPGHAAYFAELLDAWAPQDHPNERLFRLGAAAVKGLGEGLAIPVLARYFEYWLLRLEGVYPMVEACAACGRALAGGSATLASGGDALLCPACSPQPDADLSPAALAFLQDATARPPAALGAVALPGRAVQELERMHRALLVRALDREPRSLRVIHDMQGIPAGGRRGTGVPAPALDDRRRPSTPMLPPPRP
jgi:DNA repair protein RecO (recombination protein O)